jgi:apolipoprotein N-acyltransferase
MPLNFNKKHLILLALLSGVLLSAAWPSRGFSLLAFVALIPLLLVEHYISENPKKFARGTIVTYSYITFLSFNLLTTWWVIVSTVTGALLAFILNSLFMSLVFGLFHLIKNRVFKNKYGYFSLIFFWVGYEYLHMHWSLSWSWLVFGNVFAASHKWVQWYEYTGVFGGSFWVIAVNVLFFFSVLQLIKTRTFNFKNLRPALLGVMLIIVPIYYSYTLYWQPIEETKSVNVVIVQPNVDPYNEQFRLSKDSLINRFIVLARTKIDQKTQLLVGPESALRGSMWEDSFHRYRVIDSLQKLLGDYPDLSILIGASTKQEAKKGEPLRLGARAFSDAPESHYYSYNTALMLVHHQPIQKYHKSMLVPGAEITPFPFLLKPLEKVFDFGGTMGTLGISEDQNVLLDKNQEIKAASIICYESIYGEFVGNFVRNGANLLVIITNDGWWGNSPGHRQHFDYARLRAIEYHRDVVRSANTGISAFFNEKGDDFQTTKYWEPAVLKGKAQLHSDITYYAVHGDYLAKTSLFIVSLLVLVFISLLLRNKRATKS